MKLFIVHPGYVTSPNDGDLHRISVRQLMQLYGVSPDECVVDGPGTIGYRLEVLDAMVHLAPRYDGDYARVTDEQRDAIRLSLELLEDARESAS